MKVDVYQEFVKGAKDTFAVLYHVLGGRNAAALFRNKLAVLAHGDPPLSIALNFE